MDNQIKELLLEKLNAASPASAPQETPQTPLFDRARTESRLAEVERHIPQMDALRENPSERGFPDPPGLAGRIRSFFRALVRKLIRWYIKPVAEQQTRFNNEVTPAVGCMAELHHEELGALARLETAAEQAGKNILRLDAALESDRKEMDLLQRSLRLIPEQLHTLIDMQEERLTAQEVCSTQQRLTLEESCERQRIALEESKEEQHRALEESREQQRLALERSREEQLRILEEKLGAEKAVLSERLALLEEKTEELRRISLAAEEALRRLTDSGAPTGISSAGERYMAEGSQAGEDKIIHHITSCLGIPDAECTYLDLGANHAKALSNTWYFYGCGARGVLVEANPALIAELKLYRGEDTILNRCIADRSGEKIPFYVMSGDGLSTSDREEAESSIRENPALFIERTVEVETVTVSELLERYFDPAPVILNVDIEGQEEAVLRAIDWERCRPAVVIVEMIPYRATLYVDERNESIRSFMTARGYTEYAYTGINSVFLDSRRVEDAR